MAVDNESAFLFKNIVVADSVVTLPFESPSGSLKATRAILTLETAQIRYRYDNGGDPQAGVGTGHIMDVGDKIVIEGHSNVRNFKAIRTGATSGELMVTLESD